MSKRAQPFAFFFLHLCTAWPIGVVGLALGSSLVRAGVSVRHVSEIIAATSLAFTLEFLWAPMVDASLTRRVWFIAGSLIMGAGLLAMLVTPWSATPVPALTFLAFASCSGASIAAVAVKGIMAYDVPAPQLGAASGYYTAGGTFAKAVGGAGTLFLLTHLPSKPLAAAASIGVAALAAGAIFLASPGPWAPLREIRGKLLDTLSDLWAFVSTRGGMLIGLLCVIPFGAGTEAGLIGAISREWSVSPDQLVLLSTAGAATNIGGALFAGWLSTRIGPWKTYIILGCAMIFVIIGLAIAPRTAIVFLGVELFYRALATGCYTALLGIVMTAIGKGAASTKAAALWSLTNLAVFYPTLVEGAVHDRSGTVAMLWTDAGLGAAGLVFLVVALRVLRLRPLSDAARNVASTSRG